MHQKPDIPTFRPDPVSFFLVLLLFACLAPPLSSMGQKRVEWINSEYVEYDEAKYGKVRRAIGSVQFKHEGSYMFCDSAYFYEESNLIEAYSNVHIQDSDTLNLFSDFIEYLPATRNAIARGNVRLVDPQSTLTTDELIYDVKNRTACYENGGDIVSKTNSLKSRKGWYYADRKLFIFQTDVELHHPKFDLYSDTLHYYTQTEVAHIFGPTIIRSDENIIYGEYGSYDTRKDFATMWQNAWLQNKETKIEADSLAYDRNTSFAEVYRNVRITDTVNNTVFGGHLGEYDEVTGYSFLTDSAWALFVDAEDSLSLKADTLYIIFDSLRNGKVFMGYHDVKYYRKDIQGVCDSIVYLFSDSLIIMYDTPVIFTGKTQVTADTIMLFFVDRKLSRMEMEGNAFIISDDTGDQYNQVKGKVITSHFEEGALRVMYVDGNTETVYYVRDEDEELIGIDKAISDRLRIEFEEKEIILIVYLQKPVGSTYPEDELPENERTLRGFQIRKDERPESRDAIFW